MVLKGLWYQSHIWFLEAYGTGPIAHMGLQIDQPRLGLGTRLITKIGLHTNILFYQKNLR